MRTCLRLSGAVLALMLTACETPPTREQTGAVVGGIVGGVIGSQIGDHSTAGTVVGTIAGALVGGAVGRSMNDNDRRRTARVLETEPIGRSSRWINPDTGASYTVTPTRTYDHRGTPCREYTIDATVRGRPDKVVGTACRQADGSWRAQP